MIIILGIAGAGKSVQSKLLSKELGCPWVGIGNLLRQHVSEPYKQRMLAGELLDDTITLKVLSEELDRIEATKNEFVLDGCPRTLSQAEWFDKKMHTDVLRLTALIHINLDRAEAKARLLGRGRPDDHETAISERFAEYDKTIDTILGFFTKHGHPVREVDGAQSVEAVHRSIRTFIDGSV